MISRFFIVFSFLFLLVTKINTPSAFAATPPDFPSCSNPPDSVRAYHNDGLHGVVGNVSEYRGKDVVYNVEGANFLQCLCTDDGEGIQTNWWRISSLSDTEIQVLKNQGWYHILDGELWGLDNAPYMAKNSEYACRESSGGGGGEVLGATTGNVLGLSSAKFDLALTGNKMQIYSALGIGIGLLFLVLGAGLLLNRKRNIQ